MKGRSAVVAVGVAMTAMGVLLSGCGGLSAKSTCQDYNHASVSDQKSVVEHMLQDNGLPHGTITVDAAHLAANTYCLGHQTDTPLDGMTSLTGGAR